MSATLEWTLNCCVRHETNRQNLVSNGLLSHLDPLVERHPVQVCRLWQSLVQDDDVRVPFGKAHDHARAIVEEHGALKKLTETINRENNSFLPRRRKIIIQFCNFTSRERFQEPYRPDAVPVLPEQPDC